YDEIAKEAMKTYRGASKVRVPKNPFAIECALVANGGREQHVHTSAELDLLLLEAATLLYRAETGAYPDNLQQLVPKYLPEIPLDPFGGGPIRYVKKSGTDLTLYSIGAD